MSMDRSYAAVTGRKADIIRDAIGVDYSKYEREGIVFDYEALMGDTGYTLEDHIRINGNITWATPLSLSCTT